MSMEPTLAPFAVELIAHLGRTGIPIDKLAVRCKGTTRPGTMLHAAMLANNVPVVLALLDAGADPAATLSIHGKRRDADSVAPKSREAVLALAAWRARQTAGTATARTAQATANSTPRPTRIVKRDRP